MLDLQSVNQGAVSSPCSSIEMGSEIEESDRFNFNEF